jgi:riboflavin kinase/FMN adenylyltransferase
MSTRLTVDKLEALAGLSGQLHLAIGVFDGVHLGHKAVIEPSISSAHRTGGFSSVLTFEPHPSRLFRPEDPTQLIMPIGMKTAMLHRMGVDCVIQKHFDRAFASIPAEKFLAHLKQAIPPLKSIYVGENFRFGQKRAGDVALLIETGKALEVGVFSAQRIKHNGEPISSTRIRREIRAGAIESVNDLLGYNYFSTCKVVSGARLGRTIGFPTLNLPWNPECRPRYGVYRVRFRAEGYTRWQPGIANYGVKPTVAEADQAPALEIHALEGTACGQGDLIEAEWLQFIRPEQKFDSVDALKAQIAKDCTCARNLAK